MIENKYHIFFLFQQSDSKQKAHPFPVQAHDLAINKSTKPTQEENKMAGILTEEQIDDKIKDICEDLNRIEIIERDVKTIELTRSLFS